MKKLTTIILIIFANISMTQLWGQNMNKVQGQKITKSQAIQKAEEFVKNQGYTDFKISLNSKIQYESLQRGKNDADIITCRFNNLKSKSVGITEVTERYNIGFEYSDKVIAEVSNYNPKYVRWLSMNIDGRDIKIHHKDINIEVLEKIPNLNNSVTDKYPTLADEEKSKKADKEEVIEVVVLFKDYIPFASHYQMEDGELLFSHILEYFVESPKEFYGKKLEVFTDEEISEKNILRKENTKIKFKIQRKYLVKTYQNKDGTANTYEAYLGAIYKYGDIKETTDMKEIYLTHENFDKIANFVLKHDKQSKNTHRFFKFSRFDIMLIENKYLHIRPNDKNKTWLDDSEYHFIATKHYQKLKWGYECLLQSVNYNKKTGEYIATDIKQAGGMLNGKSVYHVMNFWFKEILSEIPQGEGSITKTEAIKIAKEFLKKQKYADKYKIDTAKATDTGKPYWSIWFETVRRDIKPNHGTIEVNKKTGKAKWDYLK